MNTQNIDSMFFEADVLIKDNKIAEAKELLEKIIDLSPNHGRAYNHLGWIYDRKLQDIQSADMNYKLALEHAPNYAPIYLNYAPVLCDLEKFSELKTLLDRAIDIPGANKSRVHAEYGFMYEKQGQFEEALKAFEIAAKTSIDTKDYDMYQDSIGRLLHKLGRSPQKQSEEQYEN